MHPELQAVFEADDRERAEHEAWQHRWNQRIERRDAQQVPMIYKTPEDALQPAPQWQQSTAMDPDTEAAWNRWFDAKFDARLPDNLKNLDEDIRDDFKHYDQEINEDFRSLEQQIDNLRTEIDRLKAKANGA